MKNINRLKKNEDFKAVFKRGKSLADANLVLYFMKTEADQPYRVGISVGKRLGNAVVRNRYKRLIREAVRLNGEHIPDGVDIVLIARQGVLGQDFFHIQKSFIKLMKRASLWRGDSMV